MPVAQWCLVPRFKTVKENFIAAEGMYSGQFIYCGKKAQLKIGNVMPVSSMPEGAPTPLPPHRAPRSRDAYPALLLHMIP